MVVRDATSPGDIAQRVRELREIVGISGRQLCAYAGLTPSMVWVVESGKSRGFNTRTLWAIACTFGATLDWIYAGRGSAPSRATVRERVRAARAALDRREG